MVTITTAKPVQIGTLRLPIRSIGPDSIGDKGHSPEANVSRDALPAAYGMTVATVIKKEKLSKCWEKRPTC